MGEGVVLRRVRRRNDFQVVSGYTCGGGMRRGFFLFVFGFVVFILFYFCFFFAGFWRIFGARRRSKEWKGEINRNT